MNRASSVSIPAPLKLQRRRIPVRAGGTPKLLAGPSCAPSTFEIIRVQPYLGSVTPELTVTTLLTLRASSPWPSATGFRVQADPRSFANGDVSASEESPDGVH